MKKIFCITIFILALSAPYSFAQMGHGMMREMPGGMMHEHMMGHEEMMENMTDMLNQLSEIMRDISEMMKGMPKDKMKQISSIMKDMYTEIEMMAEMMDKDSATYEEIKSMHDRTVEMKKRMSEIKQ